MGFYLNGGGAAGDVSGYNKGKVEELRDSINNTAKACGDAVVEELHSGIVVPMSSKWFAEEAQDYFEGFATAVKECGVTIKEVFDQFRANVESTGGEWATATGGEAPTLAAIDDVELNLDVSAILNMNGAGDRSLDEDGVQGIVDSIPTVEAAIKSRLTGLANQLNAETAFLGHGQGAAVQACFVKVAEAVHQIFNYLLSGDDALSGALKAFKEKYATSATNVATSFNNADVTITKG